MKKQLNEKHLYKLSGKISIKHYREDNDWHANKVGRLIKDLNIKGDFERKDTLLKTKGAKEILKHLFILILSTFFMGQLAWM